MPAPKLSPDDIAARLSDCPEWSIEGDRIKRTVEFANFLDAIAFINAIAPLAESADHHPEIFNVYNRVELVLTTHDSGGLTFKDFDLAVAIDRI